MLISLYSQIFTSVNGNLQYLIIQIHNDFIRLEYTTDNSEKTSPITIKGVA